MPNKIEEVFVILPKNKSSDLHWEVNAYYVHPTLKKAKESMQRRKELGLHKGKEIVRFVRAEEVAGDV